MRVMWVEASMDAMVFSKLVEKAMADAAPWAYGRAPSLEAPYKTPKGASSVYALWTVESTSGGSCWGEDGGRGTNQVQEGDPEPQVDTFLEAVMYLFHPDISYLKYRRKLRQVEARIVRDVQCFDEFYGNSTTRGRKLITFHDLWTVVCLGG